MDLATMILETSHKMVKEEELSKMINMQMKFDKEDTYNIYVKQHPKLKNSIILEYMNTPFNVKKNSCKCCQAVGYIFRQICRSYLSKHNKHFFDAGECLSIEINYRGQEIMSDMHTICDKIEYGELSASANADEESDELNFLCNFFTDYFKFVESIDI